MERKLDIKNLIEKAEELVYDDRIMFAEQGEVPIQIIELENGDKYQLKIIMTLI
jgi:hypothetical protein